MRLRTLFRPLLVVLSGTTGCMVPPAPGIPIGESVRTSKYIVTMIRNDEPYMATLHRNPDNDRFRLSLMLTPVDGSSQGRVIPIVEHLALFEFRQADVLGADGRFVYFVAKDAGALELTTEHLLSADDLRHAGVSVPGKNEPPWPLFLRSGALTSPTEWLGVHSPDDVARNFRSGWSPNEEFDSANTNRGLYRGRVEQRSFDSRIVSMEPIGEAKYRAGALLTLTPNDGPLRLSNPDSYLLTYISRPGLQGTQMVARVALDGRILWTADSGIADLFQILPDEKTFVLRGTRPLVPDKVSEAILAFIDLESGKVRQTSLWK